MPNSDPDGLDTVVISSDEANKDATETGLLDSSENVSGILRSTIWNWGGEIVIVVSGFILPRLINHRMSQEELGIWDFGWSIRSYVMLACGTLGSGANYYVAPAGSDAKPCTAA